jgi:cadmium resistance protein CadD (predicted permease)
MGLGGVIAVAIAAFTSTNVDDALVLVVYFANAAEGSDGFQRRHE